MQQRRVAILGSTGSIGCNAIEVIEHLGSPYRVVALSGYRQLDKLVEQANRCRAAAVSVIDDASRETIAPKLKHGTKIHVGPAGLLELVRRDDVDIVLSAIVGAAGLAPAFATVRAGKTLALANKEALVIAGELLIAEARQRNVAILPVDSEHSAIFQAMCCGKIDEVSRVILTASGGPFRNWSADQMNSARPADALKHPTWRMGDKITIDSATMFNKALEIIEACWLFDLPPEKVEVVIHPESVVHSMVEFVDGSTIAQLSPPDMRTTIQFALTYPDRANGIGRRLDLSRAFNLNFEPPDMNKFRALRLASEVVRTRGTSGAILNAANEVAVATFLAGRIPLGVIYETVERTIADARSSGQMKASPTMEDLLAADAWARDRAGSLLSKFS